VKVAYIGTHGSYKTTLCHELVAGLKRLGLHADLVKEVARSCPLPINKDSTHEAEIWISCTQIAKEIKASHKNEIVVCDRSVLDNYAYLAHVVGRDEVLEAFIFSWLRTYDLLIQVPMVQGAIEADGVRDTDRAFAEAIDLKIRELRTDPRCRVPVLDLQHGTVWTDIAIQRVQQIRGRG
jgi:predicted ATPase